MQRVKQNQLLSVREPQLNEKRCEDSCLRWVGEKDSLLNTQIEMIFDILKECIILPFSD